MNKDRLKNYIIFGLIGLCIFLWGIQPEPENKHGAVRGQLKAITDTLEKKVQILERDTFRLNTRIRGLENELKIKNQRTAVIKTRKPEVKPEKIADLDSTFQKAFPVPDSVIFSEGRKSQYVVSVQLQAYESIIEKDYYKDLAESMESTLQTFADLVAVKDSLILNQKQVITGKDDIIQNLLKTQVNDMEEITMLRKKKKHNSILLKIAIPASIIGGVVLGSKL